MEKEEVIVPPQELCFQHSTTNSFIREREYLLLSPHRYNLVLKMGRYGAMIITSTKNTCAPMSTIFIRFVRNTDGDVPSFDTATRKLVSSLVVFFMQLEYFLQRFHA